ncbi:helix-turn-helix domain-containing protein [Eggerthella guodeyinii]|uniref:Helix-turn-helix domain-containing protein n=1 Tax=Eggerthella guodeyinii TaxID=2690837 RepID=A0A6N7RP94_9ACTN|nr:helix-turn-helix transcriptional regulator [Eggerthella guodeyinii]MRX83175.1 helix-turn-helix domain-containing protein [Eggerthella guodeyinii]
MKSDDRRIILGKTIRKLREEQHLSQRRFALMVDTNQTHLWQIESGQVNVGIDLLCRIADGLGTEVRCLIDF